MKRRGFTLIELMVVIAIIIILAAIAIPNYLTMTARAKRSRVASDFAALATALETYRTDWNEYPVANAGDKITTVDGVAFKELTGTGATHNKESGGTATAAGDMPPIEYMTTTVLESMKNPYSTASGDEYSYFSDGTTWKLTADTLGTGDKPLLVRTDTTTVLTDSAS
ncbi:MAG TPA: prepilin-type N-terminal cleavage/methylation domain-containing protein [Candidatus Cryosericum sp.]